MQKWEYRFIVADWSGGVFYPIVGAGPDQLKVKYINGQQLPNWKKGPTPYDYCSQAGDEGWEIISVISAPIFDDKGNLHQEFYRIVMKRPKDA